MPTLNEAVMNIVITDEAVARITFLLEKEDDDAVMRIRESKIGDGWKSKIVLRLSIDEREDEDREGTVQSLIFVLNEELADQYGENFSVTLDEHDMPVVAVLT